MYSPVEASELCLLSSLGVHRFVGFSEVMSANNACTAEGKTATLPMNPGPSFISFPVAGLRATICVGVIIYARLKTNKNKTEFYYVLHIIIFWNNVLHSNNNNNVENHHRRKRRNTYNNNSRCMIHPAHE